MNIEGGCYCGEIRYVSNGDSQASVQCHCRQCQYITGGHPNVCFLPLYTKQHFCTFDVYPPYFEPFSEFV